MSLKWKSGTASLNMDSQWSKQEACFACATRVWLAVNNNIMSLLANEFDVRVLHRQVSLAAVNQSCVIHEAMNGCKNLDSLKDCFENVNIQYCCPL